MRRDVRARRPEPIVYSWCAMGSHFDFRSASFAIDGKWFNDIPIVLFWSMRTITDQKTDAITAAAAAIYCSISGI